MDKDLDPEEMEKGILILLVEPSGTVLDVFMDTFKVGTTPLPPRPLSPGTYTLVLKDAQKRVWAKRPFVVRPGKECLVRINLQEEE